MSEQINISDVRELVPREPNHYEGTTLAELESLVVDAPRINAGEDIYQGWPIPEPLGADLPAVPAFDLELLPEDPMVAANQSLGGVSDASVASLIPSCVT
jgi:hypothetical protein